MSALRCYLDYNATAPMRPAAIEATVAAMQGAGNPSSIHADGRRARSLIEEARGRLAVLVGAEAERVVFTSGGTEAAAAVLSPSLTSDRAPQGAKRLLVVATEHAAVLRGHRFDADRVGNLPVRSDGRIDLDALALALAADRTPALLAIQAANNETGVIQPVREAATLVRAAGGLVVCDAVQAIGRVPFTMADCLADAVLVSGHKLGGPQGTGAFVLAPGVTLGMPLVRGGGQERGLRSGTENVAGIAGFGAAAAAIAPDEASRLRALRDRLEQGLRTAAPDAVIFGEAADRLPNTTCFAVPGLAAETLLIALDLEGIAVSSGSACSSGKVSRSHVLEAMGVPPHLSSGAIRVSVGWATTEADIDRFLTVFPAVMRRMQRRTVALAA